jgi:orotidine-5'-phosphate decarboxylase
MGGAEIEHPRDRLIVALDVSSSAAAKKLVAQLGDSAQIYKIGAQLFTSEGPQLVRDLVASGRKVFLDLKFHDIPNTVASAVAEAAKLNVSMLTIHASGGGKMLAAAVRAASQAARKPMILAVTVLTSMEDSDLPGIGVRGTTMDQTLRLATLAMTNGCDGVISAAHEVRELRSELGDDLVIVTPGIRPPGSVRDDQARIVTPADAISAGASHIVVGRPITGAADPAAAAREVLAQIRF